MAKFIEVWITMDGVDRRDLVHTEAIADLEDIQPIEGCVGCQLTLRTGTRLTLLHSYDEVKRAVFSDMECARPPSLPRAVREGGG